MLSVLAGEEGTAQTGCLLTCGHADCKPWDKDANLDLSDSRASGSCPREHSLLDREVETTQVLISLLSQYLPTPLHWPRSCNACLLLLEFSVLNPALKVFTCAACLACWSVRCLRIVWDLNQVGFFFFFYNSQLMYLCNYEHRKGRYINFRCHTHSCSSSKLRTERTVLKPTADMMEVWECSSNTPAPCTALTTALQSSGSPAPQGRGNPSLWEGTPCHGHQDWPSYSR